VPHLTAPVMGTTVSIDVRDPDIGQAVLDEAVAVLREHEARFSPFLPDSEICRIERAELSIGEAHPDVREVLDVCAVLRAESDGAFDVWRSGRLDPSGYVKGWAAEGAADILRRAGARFFALNVGGDVVCAGGRSADDPWRIGVRHPDDATRMVLVLGVATGAVATSGLYERGEHVADARTGEVPAAWRSITVLAPDLASADSIATAALALGERGPAWAATRLGCEVAAIDVAGRMWTSAGMERARIA
jgi:thiamine biosynthesis lipoprotein